MTAERAPVAVEAGDSFARLIADVHRAIEDDHLGSARLLREALALAAITFDIEGERFALTDGGVVLDTDHPVVLIEADRDSVRSLIDGEADLAGSARRRAGFDLVGAPAALASAERALRLLVVGAARGPHADSFYSRTLSLCAARQEKEPVA